MSNQPRRLLTLSPHAESRMFWRGISRDDILRTIRTGELHSLGERVLHVDKNAKIGVVVNWREMVVITVMHLNSFTKRQLRDSLRGALEIPL